MSGSRGHIGWQKGTRREEKEKMPSGKGTHWAEEGGRGKEGTRQAAVEDTMSGDRERAGGRQRRDEWQQRAHRLAEGDTPRGGRENAERQGNSLGGGGRARDGGDTPGSTEGRPGGDRGQAEQRRRRCRTVEWDPPAGEGERAHRRLLGRVFGAKRDAPSDLVGGGVHLAEKPYLVPKIRSPASPRPGTM